MKVIGAGYGRTGTLSLKIALEKLGFAPCYHMEEVMKRPQHIDTWLAISQGQPVDWQAFLGAYPAGVDFPVSVYYRELLAAFPDAKVVLTVRDPQRWYESTNETIYGLGSQMARVGWFIPRLRRFGKMVEAVVWDGLFNGRFEDRSYAINRFNEHIEMVKQVVPPQQLLVYHVKEGWEPLCRFLDVPIPDAPFPHANDRAAITRRMRTVQLLAVGMIVGLVGLVALVIWLLSR